MPNCAKLNCGSPPSDDCETDMNTVTKLETRPDAEALSGVAAGQGVARQYHARLLMRDGRRFCALTDEGAVWVVTAAGCLMQPEVGDTALVSVAGAGGYVLTILERAQPERDAVVAVPGGLRLEAQSVEVAAREGVGIEAGSELCIKAGAGRMHFDSLRLEGMKLHTSWTQRTEISKQRIDIASYSESHRGYSVRRIGTHEEVTAASMRQLVSRDWSVRAATAGLIGRDRVAIDGDAVQIG